MSFMLSLPGLTPAAAMDTAAGTQTIMPSINVNPADPTNYVSKSISPSLSPEISQQKDYYLSQWVKTGTVPDLVRQDELGVHIMFITINPDASLGGLVTPVTVFHMTDDVAWVHAVVKDKTAVEQLFNRQDVSLVSADLDYHKFSPSDPAVDQTIKLADYDVGTIDGYGPITRKLIGADLANNYTTGEGVIVAPTDTGQDFGTTGLLGKMAIDENGYPMSFSHAGNFMAITNITFTVPDDHYIQTKGLEDQLYVMVSAYSSTNVYTLARLTELYVGKFMLADKYHVPKEIPTNATVKFGVMFIRNGPYPVATPFLLADTMSTIPGYDTLYIDYMTGYYFTAYALLNKATPTDYFNNAPNDFDPTTNPYARRHGHFPGLTAEQYAMNYTLAMDLNGDGYTDISFGSLSNTIDTANITGWGPATGKAPLVRMIDPDGKAIALLFDEQGHGTSVAGQIAGNPVKFPVFDWARTYSSLDSPNVNMTIQGIAPDAKIMGLGGFFSSSLAVTWLWASGFDPSYNTDGRYIEYTWSGNHMANISSNSWGFINPTLGGYWAGADLYSLFLQLLSLPGGINANFPGLIFVISYGNEGPGYMTGGPPMADVSIGVGASTAHNYLAYSLLAPYSTNQSVNNQVGWFSSKGPNQDLYTKIDIMATGAFDFGYAVTEVGNGTYSFEVFGGTSQAGPFVSGSLALLYQAYHDVTGQTLTPDKAKTILMSTANDLGYDPFAQGTGRVDIWKAINYVYGLNGSNWVTPQMRVYNTYSHSVEMQRIQQSLKYYFTSGDLPGQGYLLSHGYNALNITDSFGNFLGGVYADTNLFFGTVTKTTSAVVNVETNDGSSIQSYEIYTFNMTDEATTTMNRTTSYFTTYKLTDLFPDVDFSSGDLAAFVFNTPDRAGQFDINYYAYLGILDDKNNNGKLDIASGENGEFISVTRSLSDVGTYTVWLSLKDFNQNDISKMYFVIRDLLYDDPSTTNVNEHVENYNGVAPVVTVRLFKKVTAPGLSATTVTGGLNVTLDPSGLEVGAHSAFLRIVSSTGASALVPIAYSVPLMVKDGSTNGWTTVVRDKYYEPYDWDLYPANGGDMRAFELIFDGATGNANTLALELNWTGPDTHVAFWLSDPAYREFLHTDYHYGDLIRDVPYTGNANPNGWGYRYLVNLTEAAQYYGYTLDSSFKVMVNIYMDRIDPNVAGVVPITFKAAWLSGVLGKDITFPVMEFKGEVPSGAPTTHNGMLLTTGALSVNVTKDVTGLPEPFATDFSVKRYPIDLTISVTEEIHLSQYLIPASKLTPTSGTPSFEYVKAVDLKEGMKVIGILDWSDSSQDWDLYLLSDLSNVRTDQFKYAAATLNKPEVGTAVITTAGKYYVAVDFYGGPKTDSYIWLDFVASQAILSEALNPNGQTITLTSEGEFLVQAQLYGFNTPPVELKVEVDNSAPKVTPIYNVDTSGDKALVGTLFDETNMTGTIKFDGTVIDNINVEGLYNIYVDSNKFTGYENHTVEVSVTDMLGRTTTYSWNAHKADTEPPKITTPAGDHTIEPGQSITLKWVVEDNAGGVFEIYVDGNLVKSGQFNAPSDTISYVFTSSTEGAHNVTIVLTDIGGNQVTDTSIIVVEAKGGFLPFPWFTFFASLMVLTIAIYRKRR